MKASLRGITAGSVAIDLWTSIAARTDGSLAGTLTFDTAIFEDASARALVARLSTALRRAVLAPGVPLRSGDLAANAAPARAPGQLDAKDVAARCLGAPFDLLGWQDGGSTAVSRTRAPPRLSYADLRRFAEALHAPDFRRRPHRPRLRRASKRARAACAFLALSQRCCYAPVDELRRRPSWWSSSKARRPPRLSWSGASWAMACSARRRPLRPGRRARARSCTDGSPCLSWIARGGCRCRLCRGVRRPHLALVLRAGGAARANQSRAAGARSRPRRFLRREHAAAAAQRCVPERDAPFHVQALVLHAVAPVLSGARLLAPQGPVLDCVATGGWRR